MSALCPQSRQAAGSEAPANYPAGDAPAPPRPQADSRPVSPRSQAHFLPPDTPRLPRRLDRRSRVSRMLEEERARLIANLGRTASATDLILIDEIARLRVRSAALAASPDPSARETVSIAALILEALRRLAPGEPEAPPAMTLDAYLAARRAAAAGEP